MGEDRTGRCRGGCWGRGRDTEKEREENWFRRNGEAAAAGPGLEAVIRQTQLYMSVCPCSSAAASSPQPASWRLVSPPGTGSS